MTRFTNITIAVFLMSFVSLCCSGDDLMQRYQDQQLRRLRKAEDFYKKGKFPEARPLYIGLEETLKGMGLSKALAQTQLRIASIDIEQKNYQEAKSRLESIVAVYDKYADCTNVVAVAFFKLGDIEKAKTDYHQAIEMYEESAIRRNDPVGLFIARTEIARLASELLQFNKARKLLDRLNVKDIPLNAGRDQFAGLYEYSEA